MSCKATTEEADVSYESLLETAQREPTKRHKRSESQSNDFIGDNYSDHYSMNQSDDLQRKVSIFEPNMMQRRQLPTYRGFNPDNDDGLFREEEHVNIDDMLLQREEKKTFGEFSFFGLALVFGAIGLIFNS